MSCSTLTRCTKLFETQIQYDSTNSQFVGQGCSEFDTEILTSWREILYFFKPHIIYRQKRANGKKICLKKYKEFRWKIFRIPNTFLSGVCLNYVLCLLDTTPWGLFHVNGRSGVQFYAYLLSLSRRCLAILLNSEDGGDVFLWNVADLQRRNGVVHHKYTSL
jgi:hypothetical protein